MGVIPPSSFQRARFIFAPNTDFTPGAGLWGLAGIIEYEPNEFVLFVTFGREQADHVFDEGITSEGVVTWQSQPNQTLRDPQVQRLISHDSDRGNIRLFLRTRDKARDGRPLPYTYLGRLSYLTHDSERERPVYFQWQLIDEWPPSSEGLQQMGLTLQAGAGTDIASTSETETSVGLIEGPLPSGLQQRAPRTRDFRGRKSSNRAEADAKNRALGFAGELAVIEHEKRRLLAGGRADLADQIRHVSVLEGDGAGYDIASFETGGSPLHIEVKTTRGEAVTDFFVSANEVEFSKRHETSYRLIRVHTFDSTNGKGVFYVRRGPLDRQLSLEAIQFRARLRADS